MKEHENLVLQKRPRTIASQNVISSGRKQNIQFCANRSTLKTHIGTKSVVKQLAIANESYLGFVASADITAPTAANGRHGIPNFEVAHLIGDRFGAPCIAQNLVSLTPAANAHMAGRETVITNYINAHPRAVIHYSVSRSFVPYAGPLPTGGALVPSGVHMTAYDTTNHVNVIPPLTFIAN